MALSHSEKINATLCLAIMVLLVVLLIRKHSLDNLQNNDVISNEEFAIIDIFPKEILILDGDRMHDFTCTGMAYDPSEAVFYIGNYGATSLNSLLTTPSILKYDLDANMIKEEIRINNPFANIQGVAFDIKTNSLWYTDSKNIINLGLHNGDHKILKLGKYEKYKANGLAYDESDNTLWVLFFYKYLIHYDTSGKVIKTYDVSFIGQDHLSIAGNDAIYFSVGEDYHGNENFVVKYDVSQECVSNVYRVEESYAIEGICVIDNKLYVVNDGKYHGAEIDKNYICVYELGDE